MKPTFLQRVAQLLRNIYLLQLADMLWFLRLYWSSRSKNTEFKVNNPHVPVPPPLMLYDIMGNCDLAGYYMSGQEHALEISKIIASELPKGPLRVLEWGCGPARVLQHMKSHTNPACELWGSDYNRHSISWCQNNWSDIRFIHHGLEPPLSLENDYFDVIYCISVFTHLSETSHYQWIAEILRLLKPGGLFIGTFHGEAFRGSLTCEEQRCFDSGKLVIRDKIMEGKKNYSAYHSNNFMCSLLAPFAGVKKLDPVPGFRQDVWTAKKSEMSNSSLPH